MKKFIALTLAIIMVFTLCACGGVSISDKYVVNTETAGYKSFMKELTYDEVIDSNMYLTFRPGENAYEGSFSWKFDITTIDRSIKNMYAVWALNILDAFNNGELTEDEYAVFESYRFDDWLKNIYKQDKDSLETVTESYLMCNGTYVINEDKTITIDVTHSDDNALDHVSDANELTFFINDDGSLEVEFTEYGQLYTLTFNPKVADAK